MREFVDSREGFSSDEDPENYLLVETCPKCGCVLEEEEGEICDVCDIYDGDYENDGQPTEYDEWQDFYGGDDWDHGQYDE